MADIKDTDLLEFYKLMFPEHSLDDMAKFLNAKMSELGQDEFITEGNRIGSQLELIKRMVDAHSNQTEFAKMLMDSIDPDHCGDQYTHDPVSDEDTGFTIKNKVLTLDKSLKGTEVSGKQAKMLILAMNRNVKRVPLYNSGFSITMRAPSMAEINIIYNKLSDNINEYGKIFGAVFYLHSDVTIKEIVWEFIESLIIDSNLVKWDNTNRLRNYVSLLDYNYIILNVVTLMFKGGYDFVHVCTNTECDYTETEKIDLSNLQLTNFSKLPLEQLRFISKYTPVKVDDLISYQQAINNYTDFTVDKYRIFARVPSIGNHMKSGAQFNQEMFATIYNAKDEDEINQYLKYNFNRIFSSWIYKIEVLDDDGEVSFKMTDTDSITLALNEIQSIGEGLLIEKMHDFIKQATITHIGYMAKNCPKCGKAPANALESGLVTIDPQNAFFTMLVMRLIQTS